MLSAVDFLVQAKPNNGESRGGKMSNPPFPVRAPYAISGEMITGCQSDREEEVSDRLRLRNGRCVDIHTCEQREGCVGQVPEVDCLG